MLITKRDLIIAMGHINDDSVLNICVDKEDIQPVHEVFVDKHPDAEINAFCLNFIV